MMKQWSSVIMMVILVWVTDGFCMKDSCRPPSLDSISDGPSPTTSEDSTPKVVSVSPPHPLKRQRFKVLPLAETIKPQCESPPGSPQSQDGASAFETIDPQVQKLLAQLNQPVTTSSETQKSCAQISKEWNDGMKKEKFKPLAQGGNKTLFLYTSDAGISSVIYQIRYAESTATLMRPETNPQVLSSLKEVETGLKMAQFFPQQVVAPSGIFQDPEQGTLNVCLPYLPLKTLNHDALGLKGMKDPEKKVKALAQIAKQTCSTVLTLHTKGFIHHDLKAANVFLASKNPVTVLVGDFGQSFHKDDPSFPTLEATTTANLHPLFYALLSEEGFTPQSKAGFSGLMAQDRFAWGLMMAELSGISMQAECWNRSQPGFAMIKYDRLNLKKLSGPALATVRQKAFGDCLMTEYVNKLFRSSFHHEAPLPSRQQNPLNTSAQLYELFKCSFRFGVCTEAQFKTACDRLLAP